MRPRPDGTEHIGFLAERAGQMRRGVADGHDDIASLDQEASASRSLVLSISGKPFDRDAEVLLHGLALDARVAILQIDEAAIRQLQKRREVVQLGAFRRSVAGIAAGSGQTDDLSPVAQPLTQAGGHFLVAAQVSVAAYRETMPNRGGNAARDSPIGICAAAGPR